MNNNFRKLSKDLFNGTVSEFSVQEGNDLLRNHIKDLCGGEFNYYTFKDNKYKVFALMSELLTEVTSTLSRESYEVIAEFKDTAYGDKIEFIVDNPELFEVSVIASGTNDLLRQKITNGRVPTTGFELGVKIYMEFTEFMTGRIDWDKCVEKVGLSFNHRLGEVIGSEWKKAYDLVNSNFKVTGTFDVDKLVELAQKVASYSPTGNAIIYGSKQGLAKIVGRQQLELDAKERREKGYVSLFEGIKCVELTNHYDKATNTWALENDTLFILPEGMKPILVGFEGEAFVDEDKTASRLDRQLEYLMTRKVHLGVLKTATFGIYKYTA